MPKSFKDRGDISILELFSEICGQSAIEDLNQIDIQQVLREIPDAIDYWLQMSEDNRSTPAWYFRKSVEGTKWEVGYYPEGKVTYFDCPVDACAAFIKNYISQLSGNR